MLWTLMALLLVGMVISYVAGAKKGAAWGKPAAVLCAIALIVLVAVKIMERMGTQGDVPDQAAFERELAAQAERQAEELGEAIRKDLQPGSRLFLLGYYPVGGAPGWATTLDQWKKGLSRGLGDDTWSMVGYFGPVSHADAGRISAALAELDYPPDAVISFDGVPPKLEDVSFYMARKRPLVAVAFANASDRQRARELLRADLVDVALIEGSVYTTANLP